MVASLLLGYGLLVAQAGDGAADRAEYEARKARTKNEPVALVKLALWCEEHGLTVERDAQLAEAIRIDPKNAVARGLLGHVEYRGEWIRSSDVSEKVKANAALTAALTDYDTRRAKVANTADAQWKLALWCDQNGLNAAARLHYLTVVRLDPSRDAAWKRLGYKKQGKRRVNEARVATEKVDASARKQADKKWRPLLLKLRGWLGDDDHREEAEQALDRVADPQAVSAIWALFTGSGPALQRVAVKLFGQIESADSSRALAMMAFLSTSDDVVNAAVKILKSRDPREYAGVLVAKLRDPVKYEIRRLDGRNSPGMLIVDGAPFDVRLLAFPQPLSVPLVPGQGIAGLGYAVPQGGYGNVYIGSPQERTTTFWMPNALGQAAPVSPADQQSLSWLLHNEINPTAQAYPNSILGPHSNSGGPAVPNTYAGPSGLNFIPPPVPIAPSITVSPPVPGALSTLPPALAAAAKKAGSGAGNTASLPFFGVDATEMQAEALAAQQQMILAARRNAYMAEAQLQQQTKVLDEFNQWVRERNQRIVKILAETTGQTFPAEPRVWRRWWIKLLGYKPVTPKREDRARLLAGPKNARSRVADADDDKTPEPKTAAVSSLVEGTVVQTPTGPRPIESLKPGDEVLAQDVRTGALEYQLILAVCSHESSPTVRVEVDGEYLTAGPFHSYWVVGKGWVRGRDLKRGDVLRLLGRTGTVASAGPGPETRVFNIEVADDRDFFAGRVAVLAHDNTLPEPVAAPFDAPSSIAAAKAAQ